MRTVGYGAYRQVQAETSSAGELLLLLYDALERDLVQAEEGLRAHDRAAAHRPLLHAQEVMLELIASLDHGCGELPARLAAIYEYCYQRLLDASLEQSTAAVEEVARIVASLGAAWRHAVHAEPEGAHGG